jgi:hypothetical protein
LSGATVIQNLGLLDERPAVRLATLQPGDKVQWDSATKQALAFGAGGGVRIRQASANDRRDIVDDRQRNRLVAEGRMWIGFHLEVREFSPRGKSVGAK